MAIRQMFAYICVRNAVQAIDFYRRAYGAVERVRLAEPGGRIGHAELQLGHTTLMVSEEYPEFDIRSPLAYGGTPVTIHLQVDDADQVITRAVAAGATLETPPQDQFYGERSGAIRDPFGHRWSIGHHIETVSPEEIQRRYRELIKG